MWGASIMPIKFTTFCHQTTSLISTYDLSTYFSQTGPTETSGPPPEEIPNIPVGRNQNGRSKTQVTGQFVLQILEQP